MSHWVYAPVITDTQTHIKLLDLSNGLWDLRSAGELNHIIVLNLARYPNADTEYEVCLDPEKGEAKVEGKTVELSEIKDALDLIV